MDHTEARMRARDDAFDRLNQLTKWIAAGSIAAVGVFAVVAAETIPGQASPNTGPSTTTSSAPSPSPSGSSFFHHHRDSSSVSASAGPPMVATGSSR